MDDKSSNHNAIPEKVAKVMVDEIFRKNNVNPEEIKNNMTNDQKKMLKEMVEDLKEQVDQFNKGEKDTTKTDE
ncbi:spore coat protein [Lentibacillus amyloliquefaciens]|uniref:Spore coat protein n=1 Tax=Lentibacillus amyloliquefaciens TaxID=1472767 RepID=A0A0U4E8S6_9BACI|nr:spore coat protein [Lentibacillus amyloliquefaciens]ALX49233.1 spore coat protein [Lentibacillus amyloliquefaciens]